MRAVWAILFAALVPSVVLAEVTPTPHTPFAILHPFGPLRETRIGNLPHSPNVTLFGPMLHFMAVDLFQAQGTHVYAAHDGNLAFARENLQTGWTTTLRILRDDGLYTYYMHVDPETIPPHLAIEITQGREVRVSAGTLIASLIASPGHTLRPHLHFGMANCATRTRLNPIRYLGVQDQTAPRIHSIQIANVLSREPDPKAKQFSGDLELSVEISDRWQGTEETYPPNRVEYQIKRLRAGKRSAIVESNVLFDATQIPFIRKNGAELTNRCEIFAEIDGYATGFEARLYRRVIPAPRDAQTFVYSITQNSPFIANGPQFQPTQWITPHVGAWQTQRCDTQGQRLYPDGTYEISVRASDIFGNSSIKKRRIEILNPPCGVE